MKFITLSKKDILNLVKSLFKFGKKELIFNSLVILIPFLIGYYLLEIVEISRYNLVNYSSIFSSLIILAAFLIYKVVTKCSEFDFFKAFFQVSLVAAVIGYFVKLYYLMSFSDYPFIFASAEFIDFFSFIIYSIFEGIGISYIFYHRLKIKELIIVAVTAIIIKLLSSVNNLYYNGFHLSD